LKQALSIDSLKKYKPAAEPIYGQQRTIVKPEEMLMIAAHGWDLAGASHAGLATALLPEGQSLYTLSSTPDFEATDILAMAEQLVAV
jgi:2-haloacid dehalogenase